MGWSIINKVLVILSFLLLVSCSKEKEVELSDKKENRKIIESRANKEGNFEISVGLNYIAKKGSLMYADKNESTAFDKLDDDALVSVVLEAEDGFVYVNYLGDNFYLKEEAFEQI